MKKNKKPYLFIGLFLVVIAIACPIYFYTRNVVIEGVEATVGADALARTLAPSGTTFDETKVKVEGNTVTLLQDITFDTGTKAFAREATLNLGGHKLDMGAGCLSITVSGENKGNLTIEGNGIITNSGAKQVIQVISGGTLTIKDNVVVEGTKNVFVLQQGNLNLEGGIINAPGTTAISDNKDSTITMKSGTITGNKALNCTNTSTVVIYNININGDSGIFANKETSITIYDCNIKTTGYSIGLFDTASLFIEKGTITSTEACAITNNGAETIDSTIVIKGGTFTGSDKYAAMYLPGGGTTTITGGTITGGSGIILRSGSLSISNASVESTAEEGATTVIGNSAVIPHDALVVDNKSTGYGYNASVNVESGEFTSNNSVISTLGDEEITISGGVFSNDVTKYVEGATTVKFTSDSVNRWYVGDDVEAISDIIKSGDIIEVLQGDYINDNLPDGATVKNSGNGTVIANGEEVEPESELVVHIHELVKTEAIKETCTEDGNVEFWYCEGCDTYFKDPEASDAFDSVDNTVIFATGHDLTKYDAKDATCMDDGNIDFWYCKACEKFFKDEETTETVEFSETVLSATGHNMNQVEKKNPTCTETGNIEYWYCDKCNSYFKDLDGNEKLESLDETVIIAEGHTLNHVNKNDATCTDAGNCEYWYCEKCDTCFKNADANEKFDSIDEIIILAEGHNISHVAAKSATCINPGSYEFWACDKCDSYFKTSDLSEKFGSIDETVIPAEGHSLNHVAAKANSCVDDGNIEYWTCSVCGKVFVDKDATGEIELSNTVIPAAGHNLSHVSAKKATCKATGNYEYWYCSACKTYFKDANAKNKFESEAETVIPVASHNLTKINARAATCKEDGVIEYYVCSLCGKLFKNADGTDEITLSQTIVPATGHKLTKVPAKEATEGAQGNIEYYTCDVCKKMFSDSEGKNEISGKNIVTPVKTHDLKHTDAKVATCAEAGNYEYWYCSNCNTYYMDKDAKSAFANKDATVIPAKSHNLILHNEKQATYTEEGNIKYYSCSVCSKYFTDAEAKNEVAAKDVIIAKKTVESTESTETTNTEETATSESTGSEVVSAETVNTESSEVISSEEVSTDTASITESDASTSSDEVNTQTQNVKPAEVKKGLSAGWIVIIILLILLAVAAVVGFIFVFKKKR